MHATFGLGLVTATMVLAGCGGDGRGTSQASPTTETPSLTTAPTRATASSPSSVSSRSTPTVAHPGDPADVTFRGRLLKTADSAYGHILFDLSGQAIYLFDREQTGTAECYGACAKAWPPVLTQGQPGAAGGARLQLLSTTSRRDGSRQVTYDGHPLYTYAREGKNEVLCHNVSEFGGLWLVVTPDGQPAD